MTKATSKCGWLIPALIVGLNAALLLIQWEALPESLPAHFDLAGNASGSISRATLIYYPVIGAVLGLIAYGVRCRVNKPYFNGGLLALASGIELIIFSSTMVTLTRGTMPVFMLTEPVILIIAIATFVTGIVKSRKQ